MLCLWYKLLFETPYTVLRISTTYIDLVPRLWSRFSLSCKFVRSAIGQQCIYVDLLTGTVIWLATHVCIYTNIPFHVPWKTHSLYLYKRKQRGFLNRSTDCKLHKPRKKGKQKKNLNIRLALCNIGFFLLTQKKQNLQFRGYSM